jgi:hypothetical protein
MLTLAQQLLAQIGQAFFHGLHLGFQFAEVFFQFGDLFSFGLEATFEPAVPTLALAAASAAATFAATAMMVSVMMSMSFIAAHR